VGRLLEQCVNVDKDGSNSMRWNARGDYNPLLHGGLDPSPLQGHVHTCCHRRVNWHDDCWSPRKERKVWRYPW